MSALKVLLVVYHIAVVIIWRISSRLSLDSLATHRSALQSLHSH